MIYPNPVMSFGNQYVNFQKDMAKTLLTVEDIRNSELQYNPVPVKDFNKQISSFPLGSYLTSLGMKVDTVIISEIAYHKALDKFIKDDNILFLKHYLKVELTERRHV
jgi:putative endopeptidase